MTRRWVHTGARAAAVKRLIDLHPKDWDRLLGEERTKVGLPASQDPKALATENRYLRLRIEELEKGSKRD